jgi:hypothetical protein
MTPARQSVRPIAVKQVEHTRLDEPVRAVGLLSALPLLKERLRSGYLPKGLGMIEIADLIIDISVVRAALLV